jgi:hypothetical protein
MNFDPNKIDEICSQAHELWRQKHGETSENKDLLNVPYDRLSDNLKDCYRFGAEQTLRVVEQSQKQTKAAGSGA